MANVFKGMQWKLDTESATAVFTGQVNFDSFYWEAPDSVGDDLVVTDGDGNVVLQAKCEAAGQSQYFFVSGWAKGLALLTLDSGTLFVNIN